MGEKMDYTDFPCEVLSETQARTEVDRMVAMGNVLKRPNNRYLAGVEAPTQRIARAVNSLLGDNALGLLHEVVVDGLYDYDLGDHVAADLGEDGWQRRLDMAEDCIRNSLRLLEAYRSSRQQRDAF